MKKTIQEDANPYKYTRKINENLTLEKISRVHHELGIIYHKIRIINSKNNMISLKAIVERHFKDIKQATVIDILYDEDLLIEKNTIEKKKNYYLKKDIKYFLGKGLVPEDDPLYKVVDNPIEMARKRFEDLIGCLIKYTGFIDLDIYLEEVDRKDKPVMFWVYKKSKANDNAKEKKEIN